MDRMKISLIIIAVLAVTAIVGVAINTDGFTGGTIIKSVSCFENADCNDHQDLTEDLCKNPGETNSLCVNKPIE